MEAEATDRVERHAGVFTRASGITGALAIVLIMLGTCADILARGNFTTGLRGVVEASEILLVAAVFLGLGLAQAEGRHVRMTLVISRLSGRTRRVGDVLASAVAVAFFAWLAWASTLRAYDSIINSEYRFGLVRIPLWPGRVAVVVGLLLLLAQLLRTLVAQVRGKG